MDYSRVATAAAIAGLAIACSPVPAQTSLSAAPTYKYDLTAQSAYECGLLQAYAARLTETSSPEWSKRHSAMNAAWMGVAVLENGGAIAPDIVNRWADSVDAKLGPDKSAYTLERVTRLLKPCEVMAALHREDYAEAIRIGKNTRPELFADDAAFKRQIGGEYPEAPTKELSFGDWFFFAKGNLCFAASPKSEKGQLTLGFINFFDGSLRLEGDNLPELTEANYETEMPKHQAGISWSKDEDVFLPVLDEGVTYDTFQGTAIFVDQQPVAMLNGEYLSMGTKYIFGAHIQRPYFNLMPVGRELTVKVLGEETHRFPIDTALWNEIAECMAQYPFG